MPGIWKIDDEAVRHQRCGEIRFRRIEQHRVIAFSAQQTAERCTYLGVVLDDGNDH